LDSASPTLFANPFRAADAGNLVPINNLLRDGVDSTLARDGDVPNSLGGITTAPVPNDDALFTAEVNAVTAEPDDVKFKHRDSDRNPYFRYAPLARLSSMTTTRSNVFAVWVTIGFFEVEEAPAYEAADPRWNGSLELYNRIYPDGYAFGKEAGLDTGDVERVRMFAIIDRTIPVGFEPGANHNVRQTIRLMKQIE
jgi:hypothetical protein